MSVILRGQPLAIRFRASFVRGGPDECWLWAGCVDLDGYGRIHQGRQNILAHRLAWSIHNGEEFPAGRVAMHSCDRRACVNPNHIRPGTIAENTKDAVAKGRHIFGERSSRAKLSNSQVLEILELKHAGASNVAIGKRFGVSDSLVSAIARGKKWSHLKDHAERLRAATALLSGAGVSP